jgi:hypothetical protein
MLLPLLTYSGTYPSNFTAYFGADQLSGQSAVYLVSYAHNCGSIQQAIKWKWSGQGLKVLKGHRHESEEKVPNKKVNPRNSKLKRGKLAGTQRNIPKMEMTKDLMEEAATATTATGSGFPLRTICRDCRNCQPLSEYGSGGT